MVFDFGHNGPMAPDDPQPDVLSSLPRTRPQRRSAKRDAAAKPAAKSTSGNGAKAPAKPKARAAAKPKAKATAAPRAKAKPRAERIPPAGFEAPRDKQERPLPGGVELIGTAIQAAGELAQIGIAVGKQALGSVLERGKRS
jgi:hypothetical protein